MGGPPPRAAVVRRGTSKAVPIVVSAGLAIGVFCGLLFGLGTGESVAETTSSTTKKDDASFTNAPAKVTETTQNAVIKTPSPPLPVVAGSGSGSAGSGSAAPMVAAGSGSGSAAPAAGSGSATPMVSAGSGSATPNGVVVTEDKTAKLTVEIVPESVAKDAKIKVDKTELAGSNFTEIVLDKDGKKTVKIFVKASGYRSAEQKVEIDGDMTVKIELFKRPALPAGTVPTGPRPGGKKDGKSGKPIGGGLIDI